MPRNATPNAGFGEGECRRLLSLCGRSLCDLLVPEAVVGFRPCRRDLAMNHGTEATAYHGCAHVNVDNETADGRQGGDYVDRNRCVTQPAQTPWDGLHEPQPQPR